MAKQILNTGISNNDKSGDTLRAGGLKIKANFEEIYAALSNDGSNISGGDLLKTASYTDLRNLPDFKTISTTGSFNDLVDMPQLSTFVAPPQALIGAEGNMTGQIATDDNYVYVCTSDWAQSATYSSLSFVNADDTVDFALQAATGAVDSTVTLRPGPIPPEVDWTISDGINTRTITLVTEVGDGQGGIWYVCTLDGEFTSITGEYYQVSFAPIGFPAHFTWNANYQPIIDAHDLGTLSAKLFKSGDSVGRVIQHAVRDSVSNELTIIYLGEEFTTFTGMSIVIDQPEIWKRVPLNTVANLGSFKIQDNFLGTTAEANGWGGSDMYFAPNGEGYAFVYIPNDTSSNNGAPLVIGNTSSGGGGIQLVVQGTSWTFNNDGALTFPDASVQTTGIAQGQHLFLMDEVNIASTITPVDFNLLLATPAVGYMGSDTHSISIANGTPGQRLVVVNNSSLCIVQIGSHNISAGGRAEFIFTDGTYGDGWIPLYGTTI